MGSSIGDTLDVGTASYYCAASVIGLLLAASGWHKLHRVADFRTIVGAYSSFRFAASAASARTIAATELVMGLALLSLHPTLTGWGAGAALGFLAIATYGIGTRRLAGERSFRCGCGGNLDEESSAVASMVRNAVLLLALAAVLATRVDSPPAFSHHAVAVLIAVGGLCGGRLITALRRGRDRIAEWAPSV